MFLFRLSLIAAVFFSAPLEAAPVKLPKATKAAKPPKTTFSLEKLQAAYKNTGSMEADFLQEVYQASLSKFKTSKGSLKMSKPNMIRWEIVTCGFSRGSFFPSR